MIFFSESSGTSPARYGALSTDVAEKNDTGRPGTAPNAEAAWWSCKFCLLPVVILQ